MEPSAFKNILFDFGGVFFGVDYQAQERAFREIGFADYGSWYSQQKQHRIFDDFEKGLVTVEEFRNSIRSAARKELPDEDIDAAWNSILLGMPVTSLELIRQVGTRYRIFLVSNTNRLHEQGFRMMLEKKYGSGLPESIFEKVYLSHRLGMRKPDREIFDHVLNENRLKPSETVFIDDSRQHVDGAMKAGIEAWWLEEPMRTKELLEKKGLM